MYLLFDSVLLLQPAYFMPNCPMHSALTDVLPVLIIVSSAVAAYTYIDEYTCKLRENHYRKVTFAANEQTGCNTQNGVVLRAQQIKLKAAHNACKVTF